MAALGAEIVRLKVGILDYVDRNVPMLARMFEKRLRGYRTMGYVQVEIPARYEWAKPEPVIEWDGLPPPAADDEQQRT